MLDIVQLAGRKEMPGDAFVRGAKDFVGAQLETDLQDIKIKDSS
jgi:hypothetical protein